MRFLFPQSEVDLRHVAPNEEIVTLAEELGTG